MKKLLRNVFLNAWSLFILSLLIEGVRISGGLETYVVGGIILTLLFMILKPILKIITIPLNFITLGTFSFVINAIIFYILTIIVPQISITSFKFQGLSFYGFTIPGIYFNSLFAYVVSALLFSFIFSAINWITKK